MRRASRLLVLAAAAATLLPSTIAHAVSDDGRPEMQKATFPFIGVTAEIVKVEDGKGMALEAFVDGAPVDLEELATADLAARRDRYGALDPQLAEHLSGLADDDRVRVALWLHEPARPLARRPKGDATLDEVDRIVQERSLQRAAEVGELSRPWLEELRRHDEQVVASSTSPLVWAQLPVALVRELATDDRIDTIYGDLEEGGPEVNLSGGVVGATVAPASGLDGSGVQVGIVESGGLPDLSNPFYAIERTETPFIVCRGATQHATGVAGIVGARPLTVSVQSPNFPWNRVTVSSNLTGFANQARLFAGSWCATGDHRNRIDGAVAWGARVINNSYFTQTSGAVTADDRHADGVVHNNWRLFVKSAGNRGGGDGRVTSPGNGYNVLAVGNVDLRGTTTRSDDVMAPTSSSVDPTSAVGDREKPEVAAPGTSIRMPSAGFPWPGQTGSGTSFAAPMVTGEAARLIQRKPVLGIWPEQLRAIIMASAVHNIEGASRLSEQDGAGMVAVDSAARILDDNRHGGRRVGCSTFGQSQVVDSANLAAGQRLRAAISWTADPSAPDYATRPSADLDLRVRGPGGAVVASSSSFDNASEVVDVRAAAAGRYDIEVVNFRCSRDTFVGFAHTLAP